MVTTPILDPVAPPYNGIEANGKNLVCYGSHEFPIKVFPCKSIKEANDRCAVVKEAYTWLGTPYHHMGRVKGHGVDCATILAEVYENVGLVDHVDISFYPIDWNLHRESERYLAYLNQYMKVIDEDAVKPGDVVMYKWGRTFAHGAIILDPGWPHILHAEITNGRVMFGDGNIGRFAERERMFYSVWG